MIESEETIPFRTLSSYRIIKFRDSLSLRANPRGDSTRARVLDHFRRTQG